MWSNSLQYSSRFNGVYSRDNPHKIKYAVYVINLDEYSDIGIHWIALYVLNSDVTYFDSFGVEHIPQEIKTFIGKKNIKKSIFRIQAYDLIMCVLDLLILCFQERLEQLLLIVFH